MCNSVLEMSGNAKKRRREPQGPQSESASALIKQALYVFNSTNELEDDDLFSAGQESLSSAFKAVKAAEKTLPAKLVAKAVELQFDGNCRLKIY